MNPETQAIVDCCASLDTLTDVERDRVLDYLRERYRDAMSRIIENLTLMQPNPPKRWPSYQRAAGCGPNSDATVHLGTAEPHP